MELRLLVETSEQSRKPSIIVDGRQWALTEPLDIHSEVLPQYTCISYVWGEGRTANTVHPTSIMSDRTLPSLAAAMCNHGSTAFWIDAFCVPVQGPQRSATLESMGFIYSRAACVIAVLSSRTFAAIGMISNWNPSQAFFERAILDDLEADAWIRSAWTFQEVINSRELLIVGEDDSQKLLKGIHFLNHLGHYISKYQDANGVSAFQMTQNYPHLDAFQDLIIDWQLSNIMDTSALQVLSAMDRRVWVDNKNYFYSMIGVISSEPSTRSSNPTIETLSETFMGLCEAKGDYSFVYSAAERDDRPGFRWRPRCTVLPSVLSWHSSGESQPVRKDAQGIWLQKMMVLEQSPVGLAPRGGVMNWLHGPDLQERSEAEIADRTAVALTQMGFTGSLECISTAKGLFYPQHPLSSSSALRIQIGVATSLRWTYGAPGLLAFVAADAGPTLYIPGVFVGDIPDQGCEEELLLR